MSSDLGKPRFSIEFPPRERRHLEDLTPDYESVYVFSGQPFFRLFRIDSGLLFRFQPADFLVQPDKNRIIVESNDLPDQYLFTILLQNVLPFALSFHDPGFWIHAAAVSFQGRALVLVGESGAGKSTLTAALIKNGASLIADDALLLTRGEHNVITALSGIGLLKLCPDAPPELRHGLNAPPPQELGHKLAYDVPNPEHDRVPIIELFALERGNNQAICISKWNNPDGMLRFFLEHSYMGALLDHSGIQPRQRLAFMARLAQYTPVSRFSYPGNFEALDSVAHCLLARN